MTKLKFVHVKGDPVVSAELEVVERVVEVLLDGLIIEQAIVHNLAVALDIFCDLIPSSRVDPDWPWGALRYLPNGVMNVVRFCDSSSSSTV